MFFVTENVILSILKAEIIMLFIEEPQHFSRHIVGGDIQLLRHSSSIYSKKAFVAGLVI
jgi:hypothetical protein